MDEQIDTGEELMPRGDEPLPAPPAAIEITAEAYLRQAAWLQGCAEADLDYAEYCARLGDRIEHRRAILSAWHFAIRAERMRRAAERRMH
jgi:hypothetical protein